MGEWSGWEKLRRQFWFQAVLFALLSVIEYVIIETFLGGDYGKIGLEYSIKNVMLLMGINLIIVAVTRWLRLTFLLSGVFVLLLGAVNYLVDASRGYGIVYMDIYAAQTAATVAGDYKIHLNLNLILGVMLGVLFIIFCMTVLPPYEAKKGFRAVAFSVVGLMAGVGFFSWVNFGYGFFSDVNNLTWDHSIGISEYGYLLYVSANAGEAEVKEPKGYSPERADEILSRYQDASKTNSVLATHAGGAKAPHLLMVMNESFADLSVLGDLETDQPYLSFFNSLHENTIRGFAESSVYGGYTANSEFEFLTGCTKAFMPGNPYLQYIDDTLPNLISNIKAQEGYKKAVAVHPYKPSGYNRNRVYPLLSLDEFLDISAFSNPVLVRKYISDASDYQMLEKLYEERDKKSSLCVFNVTMQNHSAYDDKEYQFASLVRPLHINVQPEAEQYLSLMKMSDDALRGLVGYLEKVDEPVLLLVFGDHQPHLPDYFYQRVMGKLPDDLSDEDGMKRYLVPFMIWANYDIGEAEIPRTSINYLSTLLTETAGLKLTDFQKFLLDMYQYVPSVSANGYFDSRGELHSWEETENDVIKWIDEYRIVEYNYIFDRENRVEEHFQIK